MTTYLINLLLDIKGFFRNLEGKKSYLRYRILYSKNYFTLSQTKCKSPALKEHLSEGKGHRQLFLKEIKT